MKVLVLHGYTQSGPFFERKLSRLRTHLQQVFPNINLVFPTAHLKLKPSEVTVKSLSDTETEDECLGSPYLEAGQEVDSHEIESYAWYKLHGTTVPQDGLQESITQLAHILETEGPFEGMIGFSQGSSLVGLVASMLENPQVRKATFTRHLQRYPSSMKFPAAFEDLDHPPLKFCVSYATYMGIGPTFAAFYSEPLIETPFLHFFGRYDPVLNEDMRSAVEAAHIGGRNRYQVVHSGAHIVPVTIEHMNRVASFIAQSLILYDISQFPGPEQFCDNLHGSFQHSSSGMRSMILDSSFQTQMAPIFDRTGEKQMSEAVNSVLWSQSSYSMSITNKSSRNSRSSSLSSTSSPLSSEAKAKGRIRHFENSKCSDMPSHQLHYRKSRRVRVVPFRRFKKSS